MSDVVTSVRLSEDQAKALDRIAQHLDRSRSWLIRRAVDEFIKRNERRPRGHQQDPR